jgi:hypothetical protein
MEGLQWETLQLPLAAGLNQKADDRARQPPYLDICKDVQFDEIGGLQTRYPYAALGEGQLGTNCRRLVDNNGELLVFTKDALYSWDSANGVWVNKGTHLAVTVEESAAFATTDDQIDVDRAESGGVVIYVWGIAGGTTVYVAAVSKATGTVIAGPTAIAGAVRPRVVALDTVLHVYWIVSATGVLRVLPIDPTDVVGSLAGSFTSINSFGVLGTPGTAMYDVCPVPNGDMAIVVGRLDPTTFYAVHKIPADPAGRTSVAVNRVCDGPIAVSCTLDRTQMQVVRTNGTNIQGDLITVSSLADTAHVGVAVGTVAAGFTVFQVAAAYRSVQDGGQYRCYAFWYGADETGNAIDSGNNDWTSKSNWIDQSGATGTEATFVRRLAVASRAFDHDGRIFVMMQFFGESEFAGNPSTTLRAQLQNTYFLYRDDGLLVAKAASMRAGGMATAYREGLGRLAGVALVDGGAYACCLTDRRIVHLGTTHTGYSDRGPRDILLTFDDNRARRCVRLGETLYIAGGEVKQYDGAQLAEVGFHVFPWYATATENNGTGSVGDGTYTYKATWRWSNARGERDRSTTASHGDVTLTGGTPQRVLVAALVPLYVTHKTANPPAVEIWRTAKDPLEDSPFFLVTSRDPASTSNPNRYLANDGTAASLSTVNDELADASLTTNEGDSEGEGILANLAPPPCTIIIATDTRLFLAGIAGDPNRVWYSLLRGDGEIARFNGDLTIDVPPMGGDITALAILEDTLIVFRETAIYAFPGFGVDNTGGGQNYGPARTLATDVGAVSHESVALTSSGLLFKSSKGWFVLLGTSAPQYIGDKISDYDGEDALAVDVLLSQHQVRVLTASRMLVFDTIAQQWGEWTISDGLHACMWQGTHVYLASSGPKQQLSTYTFLSYGIDVETTWIKPDDLQGWIRLRKLMALGEYRSAHDLRLRVAYDYSESYVDDVLWTATPTTVGGPLEVGLGPSRQRCKAFKLRITAQTVDESAPPSGEALKLTGLGIELGRKRGLKRLPSSQRAG